MNKQFTASEVRERERFEEWYTTHACNYSRDPIGSRDCSLQWESWKAALAAHSTQAQPPAARVTDAMVERGLEACIQDSDARLSRYKVVRSIIEAALAAQENPNG